jgi:3-oxoacyl-[acyl-carrier-protein] synthase-3
MRYQRVYVEAVEYAVPDAEVTTAALERMLGVLYKRVGASPGVIEALTGVRARRFWPEGVQPSDGAALAGRALLDKLGPRPYPIGALLSTSVCKDYLEPSTASLVHGKLGLPSGCLNFDVGNACLGFLSGIQTVANLIELDQIPAGLVVAGEGSRQVTQATVQRLLRTGTDFPTFAENLATLTLGSAGVAMLLVHERHATRGHQLLGGASLAATEFSHLCIGTATEMKTDAARLLREGVALAERTWLQAQANLGLGPTDFAEFALHQVGQANHDAILQRLGLPSDKALRLYPEHGNVGAAGVVLTLARLMEAGRLKAGDAVMMMGIGSGLNCSMMALRCGSST